MVSQRRTDISRLSRRNDKHFEQACKRVDYWRCDCASRRRVYMFCEQRCRRNELFSIISSKRYHWASSHKLFYKRAKLNVRQVIYEIIFPIHIHIPIILISVHSFVLIPLYSCTTNRSIRNWWRTSKFRRRSSRHLRCFQRWPSHRHRMVPQWCTNFSRLPRYNDK